MNNILDEKIELEKDKIINFQDEDEEKFKSFLKYNLMKGFSEFQEAIEPFYINFVSDTDMPGTTAAVNAEERIIFLNDKIVWCIMNKSNPKAAEIFKQKFGDRLQLQDIEPLVSMLIRHELLHAMLGHHKKAIEFYSEKLGYGNDISKLTDAQYEEVMNAAYAPCLVYRKYNGGKGVSAQNGAGDNDLSRAYILDDIRINELLGGLVLENNAKWANYSFIDMLKAAINEEARLKKRLYPIVECEFDFDNVNILSEQPSWFSQAVEIAPEDVLGIRPITVNARFNDVKSMNEISKHLPDTTWIDSNKQCNDMQAWTVNYYNKINTEDCQEELNIYPIIEVDNLDEYTNIKPGAITRCLGCKGVILPDYSGVLITKSIGQNIFNDFELGDKCAQYKYSDLYFFLNDWIEDKLVEYKVRRKSK